MYSMSKKWESVLRILVYATALMPLIVAPSMFVFPFIVPKIIFLRIVVGFMLAAYVLLIWSNWDRYKPKRSLLHGIVFLFFISFSISTFVGVDWYRSFWDGHERMLGLFTIFHYIAYYYITSSVISKWVEWRNIFRVFLFAGSLVMLVGVWQRFVNPDSLFNAGSDRVFGTLGNAIYYSGFGLFLFYISLLLFVKEKKGEVWRYVYMVTGLLGLLGVFLGGTRGTLIGLILSIGLLMLWYLLYLKEHKKIRLGIGALIILGVLGSGLLFVNRDTTFVRSIPAVGRLLTQTDLAGGTTQTRLWAWRISIDAWKEKPILGWGPNNYFYAFNKYYSAEFMRHGLRETWFDNAHSAIFNTVTVQGVVGIVLYFGLFFVPVFVLWRRFRNGDVTVHVAGISIAFLGGHFVHNAAVFENPTSYLFFFLFLAFIQSHTTRKQEYATGAATRSISNGAQYTALGVAALFVFLTSVQPARANMNSLKLAGSLHSTNRPQDHVSVQNGFVFPTPHIDDIRNDIGRPSAQVMMTLLREGNFKAAAELFDFVYPEVKKNLELHPQDIRIHLILSQLAEYGGVAKRDKNLIVEAERLLEEALVFSPERQQLQYSLVPIKLRLQKADEAVAILRKAIHNDKEIGESWWRLAGVYSEVGDSASALAVIQEAEELGITYDSTGRNIIAQIKSTATGTVQ